MVMYAVDELLFAGSRRLTTNVWPARRRTVSPGCAALTAAWTLAYAHPLEQTVIVAALASAGTARMALAIAATDRTEKREETHVVKTKMNS
jgi:hypothetical protein